MEEVEDGLGVQQSLRLSLSPSVAFGRVSASISPHCATAVAALAREGRGYGGKEKGETATLTWMLLQRIVRSGCRHLDC